MNESIKFTKLQKNKILNAEFQSLKENNTITFSQDGIAVVYAPNGAGKTTIARILQGQDDTRMEAEFDNQTYTSENCKSLFHVIEDQLARNIIEGHTDEFVLGDNIAKERQIKAEMDTVYNEVFQGIQQILKSKYKTSKKDTTLIKSFQEDLIISFLNNICKRGANADDLTVDEFIRTIDKIHTCSIPSCDEKKLDFYINDVNDAESKSIIYKIMNLKNTSISKNSQIENLEKNTDALKILEKYKGSNQCIVCDSEIDRLHLISSKKDSSECIRKKLTQPVADLLKKIEELEKEDVFSIKDVLIQAVKEGNVENISILCQEFDKYKDITQKKITKDIINVVDKSKLKALYKEYTEILNGKLTMIEDDELLISDLISECIGRNIKLDRDNQGNIVIKLDDINLLGTSCDKLHLSSGEQNFISLAFELLRAKNTNVPIIIMDDPISSFDSIYKNKIAYCIIKFLENKKQIIFTHNIELIHLLDVQKSHCFNFYVLCNEDNEDCGFFSVSPKERELVLYLDKLLDFLRSDDIQKEILNKEMFIISLIPFMRGIVKLIYPKDNKKRIKITENLNKLMHGYETEEVNITPIYNEIFGKHLKENHNLTAQSIINLDISELEFMKKDSYPLLERTLRHSLVYLFLRLNVEYTLKQKFPEKTRKCESLGEFIYKALKDDKYKKERIQLTSKKTLLNEFNHYEGNMNLFQPAIDITEDDLRKEKEEISDILENIKNS